MHPLTTDLAQQILALVKMEAYSLLGAIQDGKTVLGGSAGSGGGAGEPPAGFVGQLTQSNVTYDTEGDTRACSAGSAGSSSLVGNLDAIRLGIEICDDAIGDRHVDWGTGAGQVSAVDVPFATTSGSIDATNVRDAIEETYSECYGTGGSLGVHNLLDANHGDTTTDAPTEGSIIRANATPAWDELPLGAAYQILQVDGVPTTFAWVAFDWTEISSAAGAYMIHDHNTNQLGGQNLRGIQEFQFNAATTLTINGGVIARTQGYHEVDTTGGSAATDDLDTIGGVPLEGDILIIRPANDARTVVVKHQTGNIWLTGKADVSLDDLNDHLMLIYNGSDWCEL